jgi:helix-turn-helix protein
MTPAVAVEMRKPTRKGCPTAPPETPPPRELAAFGKRLLRLRLERGLTQEALSKLSNVKQSHNSSLERGTVGAS